MFFLKLLYKTMQTGIPLFVYNPFSNLLNTPFNVKPYSTYINFKLDAGQVAYLEKYIGEYCSQIKLVPIKIHPVDEPSYFLSVNIYNCTSPVFINGNQEITRCELNTYVCVGEKKIGTLILDYSSNEKSVDPVDFFSFSNPDTEFIKEKQQISCRVKNALIWLDLNYTVSTEQQQQQNNIDALLFKHTDNIYYKNGIYDKIYYDSTLTEAETYLLPPPPEFVFEYKDLNFTEIHSLFYFKNKINFVCSIWHNLFHTRGN